MSESFIERQRLSKYRWYFGIVGLIGGFALAMELGRPGPTVPKQALMATSAPILLAYFGACVGFRRLLPGPWLPRIAGTMAIWALALAGHVATADRPGSAIPVLLFIAMPAAATAIGLLPEPTAR